MNNKSLLVNWTIFMRVSISILLSITFRFFISRDGFIHSLTSRSCILYFAWSIFRSCWRTSSFTYWSNSSNIIGNDFWLNSLCFIHYSRSSCDWFIDTTLSHNCARNALWSCETRGLWRSTISLCLLRSICLANYISFIIALSFSLTHASSKSSCIPFTVSSSSSNSIPSNVSCCIPCFRSVLEATKISNRLTMS